MTQHVTIPTAFRRVAEAPFDGMRYTIDCIRATPAGSGAIIDATDCRMIAIREVDASIESQSFIPATVLNEKITRREKHQFVRIEDGVCKNGPYANDKLPPDGKFPKVSACTPNVSADLLFIRIDAKRLLQLANAVNDEDPFVTLGISGPDEPVRIVGADGIAVLMPMARSEDELADDIKFYRSLRKRHAAATADPKPAKRPLKVKASK